MAPETQSSEGEVVQGKNSSKESLLLVNPGFPRKIDGQAPLNLAYLAAAVEQAGIEVRIVDLNVETRERLHEVLEDFKPTHVGMTRYTSNNIEALALLREIADQYPELITIVGGPHERYRSEKTLKLNPWIDHVVSDVYGEEALVRILTRNPNASVDWKTLFPAYHLLNMDESSYQFDDGVFSGKNMIQYMTARGCIYQCAFCPSAGYESIDVRTAIDGLKRLVEMGYESVFVNDINFVSNKKRTEEFLHAMISEGLHEKLEWGCQTAPSEIVSDEILELMAKAGCRYVTFSLESASREVLKKINKKIDLDSVISRCDVARRVGMKTGLYVIAGILEDEDADFKAFVDTLDTLERIQPNYVSYSILADYPHTNPDVDWESDRFDDDDVWRFFDEGIAYHPHCSSEYAKKLREEILRRHSDTLSRVNRF